MLGLAALWLQRCAVFACRAHAWTCALLHFACSMYGNAFGTLLRQYHTVVNTPRTCVKKFAHVRDGYQAKPTSMAICTGGQAGNEGTCGGDSDER